MENLFYVVHKELINFGGEEVTSGNKNIIAYDIDTQAMNLVEFCNLDTTNDKNSEEVLQNWLNENDFKEYNLIEL